MFPAKEDEMGEMRLMGSKQILDQVIPEEVKKLFDLDVQGGDTKIMWNPRDRDERGAAEKTFKELVKKGFHAFKVNDEGNQGEQVSRWDPEVGKLILAPPMAGG